MSSLLRKYEQWVRTRWDRWADVERRIIQGFKIGGEAGEVQDLLGKEVRDKIDVKKKIGIELGDLLFYLVSIAQTYGHTLEDIVSIQFAKHGDSRPYPVLHLPDMYVPWGLVELHAGQAMVNHSQTVARLAERGGLSVAELACVLEDKPLGSYKKADGTAALAAVHNKIMWWLKYNKAPPPPGVDHP